MVDNYRWNMAASADPMLSALWWWFALTVLGWLAWPIAFVIFKPLRDRGYLLSRTVGWLFAGWLLWLLASYDLAVNSVLNTWIASVFVALLGLAALVWQWPEFIRFVRTHFGLIVVGELLFAAAYVAFVFVRMGNPDIWQPWLGGEKFMEFAFLNGILRSPTFPPVDPHFAGGFINYYYFGIYLVGLFD